MKKCRICSVVILIGLMHRPGHSVAQNLVPQSGEVQPPGETPAPVVDAGALIARALSELPPEPRLEELSDAALRYLDAHPEAVARLLEAPRRAAILPELRLAADLGAQRDESLNRYQTKPDLWGADTDRDIALKLTLVWRLDRLVYSPDQARTHAVIVSRAERREAVLTTLVRAYFERRKLQLRLHISPPSDVVSYLEAHERIEELGALIDALTGGALRRHSLLQRGVPLRP
jgi:hypothetical protein